MRFYNHQYGYKNGREFGLMIGRVQIRAARHQFALWVSEQPMFNFLY